MNTPRVISNSGGRTSGYMTYLEMQHGLGPDDYVIFCNTGKEKTETLDFLHQQETVFGVPLIWLEYCPVNKWKRVSYETAARQGEPFTQLMLKKKAVPSHFMGRFCTTELKIKVKVAFMRSQGHPHFTAVIGIRADEPKRHFDGLASTDKTHDVAHPLYHLKIGKADVLAWWKRQAFDLEGDPAAGNCDLCFLKGAGQKIALLARQPELATWWIEAEEAMGHPFSTRYTVRELAERAAKAAQQTSIDFWPDEVSISCFCTD